MGPDTSSHRSVGLRRTAAGRFRATNVRGGTLDIASDGSAEFTPVELLLVAIAACTSMDVDVLTSRRAEPDEFSVEVGAEKIREDGPAGGNRLTDITLTLDARFPEGVGGDAARALLPDALRRSHDRLCTVSRTVELGSPVVARLADPAGA